MFQTINSIRSQFLTKRNELFPFFDRFLCYTFVGGIGTLAHWGVFLLLLYTIHVKPVLATSAGFCLGAVINYLLNYFITFKSKKRHLHVTIRFVCNTLLLFIFNGSLVWLFVILIGIHPVYGQVFTSAFVLVTGYIINKLWAF